MTYRILQGDALASLEFVQGNVFDVDLDGHSFGLVYADPPYANCRFKYARRNSSRQWGRNSRADFIRDLIARMDCLRTSDGACALSMTTPELELLPLFPSRRRVLAWVKPFAVFRPGVWPAFCWEPVVLWGNLPGRVEQKASKTPKDWLELSPAVPKRGGHENPKPEGFGEWVLEITLGPRKPQRVAELFAGTGPLSRAAVRRGIAAVAVDLDDWLVRDAPLLNREAAS